MKHFIRYSAVGAFATAVHYLLLVGHYLLAQVVATLANLLLTFAINRASTFR